MQSTDEAARLAEESPDDQGNPWRRWGPYLSERQWGTVREDYSQNGDAWNYLPHDHARSRAYRWGEDGLAGISDDQQRLCFALALWNGQDPILKERLFGLTNGEGNHGEDVKEYYFYRDNTPTHSWMRWRYKYPQRAYPYADLVRVNAQRKAEDPAAPEYELLDTGIFDEDRYFDIDVVYAKAGTDDLCIRIEIRNRGPEAAELHVLPTLWYRNQWTWDGSEAPKLTGLAGQSERGLATIRAPGGERYGRAMTLYCNAPDGLLFVENETNDARVFGSPASTPYPKDGINDHVVQGLETVNPSGVGSKGCARWRLSIAAGGSHTIELRLSADAGLDAPFGPTFADTFAAREREADAWWDTITPAGLSDDRRAIMRQAYAGMLWSKQFYYYVVQTWLDGDPAEPPPPAGRTRNADWRHFYAADILSMPDCWEYPWFAAWDLCFQAVVFARIDPAFAKQQLLTLAREWYMSPAGALPAYEWAFGDVNPPLHAWAALRIADIEAERGGVDPDQSFLESIFRYCLMVFTWWSNQKTVDGTDLFGGGFLGLDNISIVDRSHLDQLAAQLGEAVGLEQSDGTSWMGLFSLNMVELAVRLAGPGRREYDELAVKFFQNFVFLADAMNGTGRRGDQTIDLWDDAAGFYFDHLRVGDGEQRRYQPIQLISLVGVIALFPCLTIDFDALEDATAAGLRERIDWFARVHPGLLQQSMVPGEDGKHLLSFVSPERLERILERVLDEAQLLGAHGVRGLSSEYRDHPYTLNVDGAVLTERYEPAESAEGLFGGNSNWRGPVWFPINYLLVQTLYAYHDFLGDDFTVEFPTGSGESKALDAVARALSERLITIFELDESGTRPVFGGSERFKNDPHWRDLILFYEYFHGDNGAGIGASHQTGWTGLVAELLHASAS